jgi:hypothetical protein
VRKANWRASWERPDEPRQGAGSTASSTTTRTSRFRHRLLASQGGSGFIGDGAKAWRSVALCWSWDEKKNCVSNGEVLLARALCSRDHSGYCGRCSRRVGSHKAHCVYAGYHHVH